MATSQILLNKNPRPVNGGGPAGPGGHCRTTGLGLGRRNLKRSPFFEIMASRYGRFTVWMEGFGWMDGYGWMHMDGWRWMEGWIWMDMGGWIWVDMGRYGWMWMDMGRYV